MSSRHRRTLEEVFENPVRANIVWKNVEAMLEFYGATISERRGSVIAVELNQRVATFHRPHPQKEAKKYVIRDLRDFLMLAGLTPDEL